MFKKSKNIVSFKTGKLDSNAAEENGKYPFFTCAQQTYRINKYSFDTECVLLAGNNAAGIFPLKYYKGKFNAYQRTYIIEPLNKNELSIKYFYYTLRPLLSHFEQSATGVTTKFLTLGILDNLDIPLPQLPTQRKIAAVLSAYDDLIENNNRRIAILEKMAEEIYREWFVRMRFPGHEKVKFQKGMPEGWEIKTIGDVCTKITDGSHFSPPFHLNGKPMASVKDMDSHGFSFENIKTISEQDYEKLVKSDCKPLINDVLIAKDGSYLKHVFVWNDSIDLVILSSIAILRPNMEFMKPFFLSLTLRQESTKSMMSGYVSGSALPRIILNDFKKMKILVPDIEILNKFDIACKPFYGNVGILIKKNNNLTHSRGLLLSRLISGKLSVEDLDIKFPQSMEEDLGESAKNAEEK